MVWSTIENYASKIELKVNIAVNYKSDYTYIKAFWLIKNYEIQDWTPRLQLVATYSNN